ncbi:hypothetical protein [Roseitranquillus sediminis]|uniref:hypothetical protein n=1 Tax=Roseitranquillus sediminis TaxID=2809051 RepID=UPI001D0CA5E8|nr:hypothetical protein [Roseitranquillus sediminis]MBM9594216.1 hypothetical protein [Roseitranquillus sediminis]
MRHTLMINLDEAHALQLDELRQHFKLSAEDTVRLAIRTAHAIELAPVSTGPPGIAMEA